MTGLVEEVKKMLEESVFTSSNGAQLILFRNAPMMIDSFQKMIKLTVPLIAASSSKVLVTTRTSPEQRLAEAAMKSLGDTYRGVSSKKLSELKENKNDTFLVSSSCQGISAKPKYNGMSGSTEVGLPNA